MALRELQRFLFKTRIETYKPYKIFHALMEPVQINLIFAQSVLTDLYATRKHALRPELHQCCLGDGIGKFTLGFHGLMGQLWVTHRFGNSLWLGPDHCLVVPSPVILPSLPTP